MKWNSQKIFLAIGLCLGTMAAANARAAANHCADLKGCIELASKVTGKKYIYSKIVDGRQVGFSSNVVLTAENAEVTLTNLLYMNQLTRVPNGQPDTYYIIESKSAIQSPVPVFEASLTKQADLPLTFDVVTLKYTMIDKQVAVELQRFLTDLVPREGRVTAYPDSSVLLITDSAQNIRRIVEVLKTLDKPMPAEFKAELKARSERARVRHDEEMREKK